MALRSATFLFACAALLGVEAPALADAPKTDRAAAAHAFDEAVARFEQADYAGAARAFLKADDLAPSTDALHNAIAAARRANDHLLVVTAAERAIARPNERQELVTEAREALAVAARSLAQVDLNCVPAPCKLLVDGKPSETGKHYMLPGAYSAVAVAEDGNRTEERLTLSAGVTYSVLIHAVKAGEASEAAAVSTHATDSAPEPSKAAPAEAAAPERRPPSEARADHSPRASNKPLSPIVFYVGAGVTAVLIGINVWSGIDAWSAKDNLPNPPTTPERDEVRAKEVRSDVIFASVLVVGGATAAAGLLWVDWGGGSASAGLAPSPGGGATAYARGRF
jgi:hypothetical protein